MTSFLRTFKTLCRTPLVRQPLGPQTTFELSPLSSLNPTRPSLASRRISSRPTMSTMSTLRTRSFSTTPTHQASDKGKMELYSDESGSTGAGIDDVAKTDAAYDTSKGPEEAARGVEQESGKDFTQRSPANKQYSEDKKDMPLGTSRSSAEDDKTR